MLVPIHLRRSRQGIKIFVQRHLGVHRHDHAFRKSDDHVRPNATAVVQRHLGLQVEVAVLRHPGQFSHSSKCQLTPSPTNVRAPQSADEVRRFVSEGLLGETHLAQRRRELGVGSQPLVLDRAQIASDIQRACPGSVGPDSAGLSQLRISRSYWRDSRSQSHWQSKPSGLRRLYSISARLRPGSSSARSQTCALPPAWLPREHVIPAPRPAVGGQCLTHRLVVHFAQ